MLWLVLQVLRDFAKPIIEKIPCEQLFCMRRKLRVEAAGL